MCITTNLILFALSAYLSVLYESSYDKLEGDILAIITVLQFPPSESFRILVNLESRYGICFFPSERAFMQLPKHRERLATTIWTKWPILEMYQVRVKTC